MLGNLRPEAWAEVVDLVRGHSRDCKHLAAIGAGRHMDAVVVIAAVAVAVAAAVVVEVEEEGEVDHEQERS